MLNQELTKLGNLRRNSRVKTGGEICSISAFSTANSTETDMYEGGPPIAKWRRMIYLHKKVLLGQQGVKMEWRINNVLCCFRLDIRAVGIQFGKMQNAMKRRCGVGLVKQCIRIVPRACLRLASPMWVRTKRVQCLTTEILEAGRERLLTPWGVALRSEAVPAPVTPHNAKEKIPPGEEKTCSDRW